MPIDYDITNRCDDCSLHDIRRHTLDSLAFKTTIAVDRRARPRRIIVMSDLGSRAKFELVGTHFPKRFAAMRDELIARALVDRKVTFLGRANIRRRPGGMGEWLKPTVC